MTLTRLAPLVAATLLTLSCTTVIDRRVARMDAYLRSLEPFGFSGTVRIEERGLLLLEQSYGPADSTGRRLVPSMPFPIASLTKPITAAAVMHLREAGSLSVEDPISRFFPEAPDDKRAITVHQLLTHTSGLHHSTGGDPAARDERVERILRSRLRYRPGERYSYSNSGYELLAAIIEKASGNSFEAYVRRTFFAPLQMTSSGFQSEPQTRRSVTVHGFNEWHDLGSGSSGTWHHGSGDAIATAEEFQRWFKALYGGALLRDDSMKLIFTGHVANSDGQYGYGWNIGRSDWGPMIHHGGDNHGMHLEFRFYPELEQQVALFMNNERYDESGIGLGVHKRGIVENLALLAQRDEPGGDPVPRTIRKSAVDPIGSYILPSGGRFVVTDAPWGGHVLGAEGQEAINLVVPGSDASRTQLRETNSRAEAILGAIRAGDWKGAVSGLGSNDTFFLKGWKRDWAEFESRLGSLQTIEILGSYRLPWDPKLIRTHARLRFSGGVTDWQFTWNGSTLSETLTDTGRPQPILLPFAPQSARTFVTFDMVSTLSAHFELSEDGQELRIGKPGQGVARKQ